MRSLRVRLVAGAGLVILVALGTVALLSRQVARTEFRSYMIHDRAEQVRALARALGDQLASAPEGGAIGLDSLLAAEGRRQGRDLMLIGPDGSVVAASSPSLARARVRLANGAMEIDQEHQRGPLRERRRAILQAPPEAEVREPGGRVLGTLVLLPPAAPVSSQDATAFGSRFDLRLAVAALAAGIVALGLAWALSRRMLKPVETLTQAARRLGAGDLDSRVPVATSDEIGELSRAFNAMAEALSRQEALRRTMVSDVAHELRTPLTNLRCQIEALEDGLMTPSSETLHSLREEVLLLSRLVEDLQTLSVADAGRLALDRASVDVRDLVEGALESFGAAAAEHRLTLRNEVGALPAAFVDATRIAQVLRNLLTNAMRHTPEGGTITVSASADDGHVTVSVRDDGPGIPAEHLPHVFERFYRADPSRARTTGGAGLGLAIVQGIVHAHGGTVAAASEGGAVFRFTLPLAR